MIYYHATPRENISSIYRDGILVKSEGIYLCRSAEECLMFFTIRPSNAGKEIAVIPLDLDENLVEESNDHNKKYIPCDAFIYPYDIAADKIPPLEEILLYELG